MKSKDELPELIGEVNKSLSVMKRMSEIRLLRSVALREGTGEVSDPQSFNPAPYSHRVQRWIDQMRAQTFAYDIPGSRAP